MSGMFGTTAGPWAVDPLGLGTLGDVCTVDGSQVAQAQMRKPNSGFGDTERAANARAIAQIPAMLKLVATTIDWVDAENLRDMDRKIAAELEKK